MSVGTDQVHDFNPGIAASDLFWTRAVPMGSVAAQGASGSSSMVFTDSMFDFFTIENALFGGGPTPVPASVSVDVSWSGATSRDAVEDDVNDFSYKFVESSAFMKWSVTSGAATYMSSGPPTSVFAVVGKERNGVFF